MPLQSPAIADTKTLSIRYFGSDNRKNVKRIYKMFGEGAPHMKIGGMIYARPERIDQWLAERESDAGQGVEVENAA